MALYDPATGDEFSDNAGDYFMMQPDAIFKNNSGDNLWLMRNGEVIKKTVRKKDLKDYIREKQRKMSAMINKRKAVGRGYYELTTDRSEDYVLTSRGLMTQTLNFRRSGAQAFSGQWAFAGVSMRWNSKEIIPWNEVLAHPEKYSGAYIFDYDNGTLRGGNTRIRRLYKSKSADIMAREVAAAGRHGE